MTLEEKLGQLTVGGGHVVDSDPARHADLVREIRGRKRRQPGRAHGVATTTLLQRIALEEPRRCIRFIFGFDLPAKSLVFPGGDLGPGVEAGEFELMVGSNAEPLAMVRTRTWASG